MAGKAPAVGAFFGAPVRSHPVRCSQTQTGLCLWGAFPVLRQVLPEYVTLANPTWFRPSIRPLHYLFKYASVLAPAC